jgi:phosphoribosylformylglycinamidine synthase
VSGNVSLYNETPKAAIYPTPLVVTAGLVSHREFYVSGGCIREGDAVCLVGPVLGSLGASRWQMLCGGGVDAGPRGVTWTYDPEMERAFAERAAATSRKARVRSGRVIAGGGLAVALAKSAIACGIGIEIDTAGFGECGLTRSLFSEGGPRAVYFVQDESLDKFFSIWDGYPALRLGTVCGDSLKIGDVFEVTVQELRHAFKEGSHLLRS